MIEIVRKTLFTCVTLVLIAGVALFAVSCNSEGVIEAGKRPVIYPDNNGVYVGYVGHSLTINMRVDNAEDAEYVWTVDDDVISRGDQLTIERDHVCTLYVTLTVTNAYGSARDEIRIDFIEPERPVIDMGVADGKVQVLLGTTHVFAPRFIGVEDESQAEWRLDFQVVGKGSQYTFKATEMGIYTLSVWAYNQFGSSEASVIVEVVDKLPYSVYFEPHSPLDSSTDMVGVVGRPVYIQSYISNIEPSSYAWSVDGREIGDSSPAMRFTPQTAGRYVATVKVTGTTPSVDGSRAEVEAESSVIIDVYATAGKIRTGSTASVSKIFEYIPGPGQFINETEGLGGFDGSELTMNAAVSYAKRRMDAGQFVSLGAFGGYIVVGFDHSVTPTADGKYDFAVVGNAFDTSSEPGIVWVMQDTNGNGLPDDQWYQLAGSETGKATTFTDYAVTYRRGAPATDVEWFDNRGGSGVVPSMHGFHSQSSIYPAWITGDTYTVYGVRLEARNGINPSSGQWVNAAYPWGYADNMGSDVLDGQVSAGEGRRNGFSISNAILPDGTPVKLDFIDFVKVQTGAVGSSGILGEISTEVINIVDL